MGRGVKDGGRKTGREGGEERTKQFSCRDPAALIQVLTFLGLRGAGGYIFNYKIILLPPSIFFKIKQHLILFFIPLEAPRA